MRGIDVLRASTAEFAPGFSASNVAGPWKCADVGRIFQPASAAGAERLARARYDSVDPQSQVGTRHHIVPRTILRRFANTSDQLRVRDRFTGKLRLAAVGDLAVKDFYTFVDLNMSRNSAMEVWLSEVEAEFARVIRPLVSTQAFGHPQPPTGVDRFALDTFVAVQAVRGMRTRRAMELIADYSLKLVNQDTLDDVEIRELELVPHQNEHIQFIQQASEKLAEHLSTRPVAVVRLDASLLVISDEPVVLAPREGTAIGDLRRRLRIHGERVAPADIVQISSGLGVGFHDADEVILPLSPRHALVYGTTHSQQRDLTWDICGHEALRIARDANRLQARTAIGWVAAHPDGPHLAQIPWPPPVPVATIYDDRSAPAQVVNARPHARPHRLSNTAPAGVIAS